MHGGLGAHIFAWFWAHYNGPLEKTYGELKDGLFQGIQGEVLEIGPGAGINLRHYPKHVHVIGVEPNPHMHKYLRQAAENSGIALSLQNGHAEELHAESASKDAVVSTLVLCSVDDVARALQEIRRVLKPGGRFYFIEHVAAPRGTFLRRTQDFIAPLWRHIGDGCNPNRETWRYLEEAGFAALDFRPERISPIPLVAPHIVGTATK
ncbi:MAG: class I SAM-dependent methyltransferase [Candidatus Hydrogenedentes bacterium]|nr:class I SAM-dependent methyltransferase [Candidatus Hydrogenedentota bacterium]